MSKLTKSPKESSPHLMKESKIVHKLVSKKHSSASVIAARAELLSKDGTVDPFIKKLRLTYLNELDSGVEGVTSKCHYMGLTGLAQSYHAPNPLIKEILRKNYDSLSRVDKDILAAYGYLILMGDL